MMGKAICNKNATFKFDTSAHQGKISVVAIPDAGVKVNDANAVCQFVISVANFSDGTGINGSGAGVMKATSVNCKGQDKWVLEDGEAEVAGTYQVGTNPVAPFKTKVVVDDPGQTDVTCD